MVWECEIRTKKLDLWLRSILGNKLASYIIEYPYPGNMNLVTYEVNFLKYNYTGISYSIDDIAKLLMLYQIRQLRRRVLSGDI